MQIKAIAALLLASILLASFPGAGSAGAVPAANAAGTSSAAQPAANAAGKPSAAEPTANAAATPSAAQPTADAAAKSSTAAEPSANAAETPAAGQPRYYADGTLSAKLPYPQELRLQGIYASQASYFNLGTRWSVQQSVLHLDIRASRKASLSSLTVEINGKPVHSAALSGYGETGKRLDVAVPADAWRSGSNEIRLWLGNKEFGEIGFCVDERDKDNWLTVQKSSWLEIGYRTELPSLELSQFPYPFLKDAGDTSGTGTSIVLPDQPDEAETAAALQAAASLGSYAPDGLVGLHMDKHAAIVAGDHRNDHLIYVGRLSEMPEEIRSAAPQEAVSRIGEGPVLFRTVSPYNPNRILMVIASGDDSSVLDTAARLLQNKDMTSQLSDSSALIPAGTDINLASGRLTGDTWTLEQLGYDNGLEVRGPLRQQTTFDIKLPSNKLVVPGAKAKFQLRYARNLNFGQSLATLYVNGIPAGSKKLDASKADGDVWEVNIPSRAAKLSYLEFSVAFDLQMNDLSCAPTGEQTPWAYVDPSSSVSLPAKDERSMLLDYYPWPFIKNGKWNDAAFALPSDPDGDDYSLLAGAASYLGRSLTDNSASLKVLSEGKWNPTRDKGVNVIAAGTPASLPALKALNGSLWFRYDSSFSYFISNEKRRLLPEFAKQLVSLQLIPSPADPETAVLAVTAPDERNLALAGKFLAQDKNASGLIGNAVLINRWGEATNHAFSGDDSYSLSEKVNLSTGQARLFTILFGTVLLLLIAGIVFYLRKYRRR